MSLLAYVTDFVTKYFDDSAPSRRLLCLTWFQCSSRDEALMVKEAVKNALTGPDGSTPRFFIQSSLLGSFQANEIYHVLVLTLKIIL